MAIPSSADVSWEGEEGGLEEEEEEFIFVFFGISD